MRKMDLSLALLEFRVGYYCLMLKKSRYRLDWVRRKTWSCCFIDACSPATNRRQKKLFSLGQKQPGLHPMSGRIRSYEREWACHKVRVLCKAKERRFKLAWFWIYIRRFDLIKRHQAGWPADILGSTMSHYDRSSCSNRVSHMPCSRQIARYASNILLHWIRSGPRHKKRQDRVIKQKVLFGFHFNLSSQYCRRHNCRKGVPW